MQDHSKVECRAIVSTTCPQKHRIKRKCHDIAAALCRKCEQESREKERKRQRDYKLDQERQAKQDDYARRLAEIQDEINHQKRLLKDRADEEDRQNALSQNREDLAKMKQRVKAASNNTDRTGASSTRQPLPQPSEGENGKPATNSGHAAPASVQDDQNQDVRGNEARNEADDDSPADKWDHSESKDDWDYQKKYEGAKNEVLDQLMRMIGKGIP